MPEAPPTVLRVLREGRDAPARIGVYVVHPGSLPATAYTALAGALPEEADVGMLDLQLVPEYWTAALAGGRIDISVEEIARRLCHEVEAVQPRGVPFVLVGWSFGGVIAFAMAEQLEERMPAERVVLLDSIAPVDEFKRPDALAVDLVLGWFAMYLAAKRGTRLPLAPGAAASLPLGDALALILQAATAARALPVWTTLPGLRKVYDTYVDGLRRNNELARAFVPHPVAPPLTLIKPAGSLLPGSRTLGWDTLAGTALDVRVCSGDHYTMLGEPTAIAAVAAIVRGHLMRPRRERAVPSPDAATVYSNRSTL